MSAAAIPTPNAFKPSAELVSFVKRQLRDTHVPHGVDRRKEERLRILVPVLVQPMDEQYRPIETPFAVVSRDISEKGIGLVHTEPALGNLLALHFSLAGEDVNVVVRVIWSKPVGPFYYSGCGFVAKLDNFPQTTELRTGGRSLGTCRIDEPIVPSADVRASWGAG